MIHFHKWFVNKFLYSYYDYSGCQVEVYECKCLKCGKVKNKKYMGKWRQKKLLALKITGIIIQFLIGLYAVTKAYKAAAKNNISFTVFYSVMYAMCLIGIWNCT